MDFQKPSTSIEEQVDLLKSRGMVISDQSQAEHYLSHINYYRLTGYWLPFEASHATHRFKTGTTFDAVLNLYIFDREFRLLLLDAIERVEVSLRAQWAYTMAQHHGPHSYLDAQHSANLGLHSRHLAGLEKELSRSDEAFIQHYLTNYQHPSSPPIWAVSEVMSFGMLSRWITQMVPSDRSVLARAYLLDQGMLKAFTRHLTYVRNLCAHHSRVWNRRLTVTMPLPRTKPAGLKQNMNLSQPRNIYNTLVMLAYLLANISPGNHWNQRLLDLLHRHHIETAKMGFPHGWCQLPIWAQHSEQK